MLCSVGFPHICLRNLMIFLRIKLKLPILRNHCIHMWTHHQAQLPCCVFCLRFSQQSAPPAEAVFNGGNDLGETSSPPEAEQPLLPSQTLFNSTWWEKTWNLFLWWSTSGSFWTSCNSCIPNIVVISVVKIIKSEYFHSVHDICLLWYQLWYICLLK